MGQKPPRCLPIYVLENGFGGHNTPDAAGKVADTPTPCRPSNRPALHYAVARWQSGLRDRSVVMG